MASERGLVLKLFVAGARAAPPRLELAFQVAPGLSVLSGPSGSGKSTCLSALAGLLRPAQGRIELAGRILFDSDLGIDVPSCERGVALVFQSLALFPHLSVAENVAFGIPPSIGKAERALIVRHWLERMRILLLAERRPLTLSGGEAQRVALARALASRPALLLLDEPFSALDRDLRQELAAEVAGLVRELDIPALLVSHQREDTLTAGARTIALHRGRIAGAALAPQATPDDTNRSLDFSGTFPSVAITPRSY